MLLSVAPKLIWIYFILDLRLSCAEKEYCSVSSFLFSTNVLSLPFSCWQLHEGFAHWILFIFIKKKLWLLKIRFHFLL